MRSFFKLFIISLLSFIFSGCVLKPVQGSNIQRYTLPSASFLPRLWQGHSHFSRSRLLIIAPIQTVPWLDTSAMAYKTGYQQISYFALHRWAARPSELLQPVIIDSLQKTGLYKSVLPATLGAGEGNVRLNIQLIDFEQIFQNNKSVYCITMEAALFSTGKINSPGFLRAQHFTVIEPATANNSQAGVEAAGRAVNQLISKLVGFLEG